MASYQAVDRIRNLALILLLIERGQSIYIKKQED